MNTNEYNKALANLDRNARVMLTACVRAAESAAKKSEAVHGAILALIAWGLVSNCTRAEWRAVYSLLLDGFRLVEGSINESGLWEKGFWSSVSQYCAYGSSLVRESMNHYGEDVLVPENMNELRAMYKDLLAARKKDAKPATKTTKKDLVKRLSKDKQIQALFDSLVKYSESHSRKQVLVVVQSLQKRFAMIADSVIDGKITITATQSANANN